jgi:isopentenyldiphosphate isomerase
LQVILAGCTGGQGGLLLAQNIQQSRGYPARSSQSGHPLSLAGIAKAGREERVRRRLTCEVGVRKCAAQL